MGRTDGQTDRRTLDRYSDPAPHAMRAVPKIAENATQNVLHRWDKKLHAAGTVASINMVDSAGTRK